MTAPNGRPDLKQTPEQIDQLPNMLTEDLILAILTTSLRLRFPLPHAHSPGRRMRVVDAAPSLTPVLNVLPRAVAPELSYLTLLLMPWIDSDVACRLGDIWLLNTMHHKLTQAPWKRPVQYMLPKALDDAGGQGHVHVLDWWSDNVGIPHNACGVANAACARGQVHTVEWWTKRVKLVDLDASKGTEYLLHLAAKGGHMGVLSVLWSKTMEQNCTTFIKFEERYSTLAHAIRLGRLDIVQWFLDRFDFTQHPNEDEVVDAIVVATALGNQVALDMLLLRFGCSRFTAHVAALSCAMGNLDFCKWCASKLGADVLDSPAAYYIASAFGHVQLLEWLQQHKVDSLSCFPDEEALPMHNLGWVRLLLATDPTWALFRPSTLPVSGAVITRPVCCGCAMGHVAVVDWWNKHHGPWSMANNLEAFTVACARGQIAVCEWFGRNWLDSFSMSPEHIHYWLRVATDHGHVQVLEWLRRKCEDKGQGEVVRSPSVISFIQLQDAVRAGHDAVVEWWFALDPAVESDRRWLLASLAAEKGRVAILDCLVKYTPLSDFVAKQAQAASRSGHVAVLDWLVSHCAADHACWQTSHRALYLGDNVSKTCAFDTMLWWLQSSCDMSTMKYDVSSWMNRTHPGATNALILDTCNKAGLLSGPFDLDAAMPIDSIPVLEWGLRFSNMEVVSTEQALGLATWNRQLTALEWWKRSGLPVKFDKYYLANCKDPEVVAWWEQSGLLSSRE